MSVFFGNWYERAVMALTGVDAHRYFAFSFTPTDDGDYKFKWIWQGHSSPHFRLQVQVYKQTVRLSWRKHRLRCPWKAARVPRMDRRSVGHTGRPRAARPPRLRLQARGGAASLSPP